MPMRFVTILIASLSLAACGQGASREATAAPRGPSGFPEPDRPVAAIVADTFSSGPDRDAADESGQLIRGLQIQPGMAVASTVIDRH